MIPNIPYEELRQKLAGAQTRPELYRAIVDSPFDYRVEVAQLHLGIIVLLLVDPKTDMVNRIALSNTVLAKGTTDISAKKFEDIKIPLSYPDNIISKAIRTGTPQLTADWKYLFAPALTPEEARFNQAGGAIGSSHVYPLNGVVNGGALIFSYFQYPEKLGPSQHHFMKTYSDMVTATLAA